MVSVLFVGGVFSSLFTVCKRVVKGEKEKYLECESQQVSWSQIRYHVVS